MDSFQNAMRLMTEQSKFFISFAKHIAHLNRSYYESLLEQGFNEEQALELVIHHGLDLTGKAGGAK